MLEVDEELLKVEVGAGEEEFSCSFSQGGAASPLGKAAFQVIDFTDLVEDPGRQFGVISEGFDKFPPNVGETADEGDFEFLLFGTFVEGEVGFVAVALQEALEGGEALGVDEDVIKAGAGSAGVPVVEDSVVDAVVSPEVAELSFAAAGLKVTDGSFVNAEIRALSYLGGDELPERKAEGGEVFLPFADETTIEVDAVSGFELPLLTVVGLMVAKFFAEEVGSETGGEMTFGKEAWLKRGGDEGGVGVAKWFVGGADDAFDGEGGGADVKFLVHFFSDTAVGAGISEDFCGDDGAFGAEEILEGVLEAADAPLSLVAFWVFSLRRGVFGAGGLGLFCLFAKEAEKELLRVKLFASGSVDFFKEGSNEFVLKGDLLALLLDFQGELGDLFFEIIDGSFTSNKHARWRACCGF